jgi:hypothetical protein
MFAFQRTAIIIFPEKTGGVFKLHVPVLFVRLIIPVFLFLGIFSGLFIREYWTVKNRLSTLQLKEARLERNNRQFLHLATRIIRLRQETEELERLSAHPQPNTLPGRGYPEQTLYSEVHAPTADIPGLVRLMHRSLDQLDRDLELFLYAIKERSEKWSLNPVLYESRLKSYINDPTIPEMIRKEILATSRELGLDPLLAFAMAEVESGFDAASISSKGAVGVLQVMPEFALDEYGVTRDRLFNPETNIRIGLSIMKDLLERFHQNYELSLAAYNAGASRVIKAGYRIPGIIETRAFVKKVKEAMTEKSLPVFASR